MYIFIFLRCLRVNFYEYIAYKVCEAQDVDPVFASEKSKKKVEIKQNRYSGKERTKDSTRPATGLRNKIEKAEQNEYLRNKQG